MIVLIPSYEPDARLTALVAELAHVAGVRVLVVDDGSGPRFASVFAQAERTGAEVLVHEMNHGKGVALRTGFAYARTMYPGEPVVCADSDGQHTLLDILRVAAALDDKPELVLGVRRFTGRVPLRSRVGNRITAAIFAAFTGTRLADTQTGLRGYPAHLLDWALAVPGDRFEYELNLLLRATRDRLVIQQVEIATVYHAGNEWSHFRPVRDSLRIYRPLLAYAASSLLGFGVDAAVLFTWYALTGQLLTAVVVARLFSATVNFLVNRHAVFEADDVPMWPSVRRYALLAGVVLALNAALMWLLTPLLGVVVAKLVTELGLFVGGFIAQHRLVFAHGRTFPDRQQTFPEHQQTFPEHQQTFPEPVEGRAVSTSSTSRGG
ncbi:MAG TPA: bifunctional glycosyltransferase family 2/GtrA family protein [Propionicimonas sp.]|nr:bifunctional glycosyltransferase family 2/GtrA family protein [Propionicimonas sp.]HRA07050.1 bifunctional glycosyltransferase family 2/GtrA family protein [Propionicimonas sp.]